MLKRKFTHCGIRKNALTDAGFGTIEIRAQ